MTVLHGITLLAIGFGLGKVPNTFWGAISDKARDVYDAWQVRRAARKAAKAAKS